MVIADRVRDVNKSSRIVARAYHDDAAELLAKSPFSCDVISTSRHAVTLLADAGALKSAGIGGQDVLSLTTKRARVTA
jgi:hypothetical protein